MTPDDIAHLISEDIDDTDEFRNEEYWHQTFRSLIDEGGLELVAHALRTHFPSDRVLEVGDNYVLIAVTLEAGSEDLRKLKIPFDLGSTLRDWMRGYFLPALKKAEVEKQTGMSKERHPLFFEDLSQTGKPWGWQVSAAPVAPNKPVAGGEGIDDTDEFLTGDENFSVTVSNKHYPNKEVTGVVGFKEGQHFPEILSLDRNDWKFPEDFARKLVWSAWWASDESRHGEASFETQDIAPGEMFQMDQGGIELLKYHNDPEHYIDSKHLKSVYRKEPEQNPPGWGKIGTHTYGEAHETPFTKYVNGKIFTRIYEQDLMNLFMNTWYWIPPGAPDTLYKSPDEIIDDYPLVFVHWAMPIEMDEYFGVEAPPTPETVEPGSVDDRDEFDADDPEITLQQWEAAERLAVREARERMLKEFATIESGYKLLYVGAKGTLDKKMKPYVVIARVAVTEDLDDKDEFRPQYARPTSVVGYAYRGYPDASLTYDFEDGARLYYMSTSDITKFILRDPEGTLHTTPTFRGSHDAPAWFDPYYQGMMVANVHEKDGIGMWARGPIQPFTSQQAREWSQITGSPVMKEDLNNYKLHVICGWCKKDLGFKPTSVAQDDGKISHGMCRDCEVKQYREMGMEPPPVTEDLDDKDEFVNDDNVCEECGQDVGFDNLVQTETGIFACNDCYIQLDQDIVDETCPSCNKVVGSENLIPSPNPNENVACRDCRNRIDKIDDKDEFMPADSDDICGYCDAIVGRENMVRRSPDPIYGDLAGIVCKQCKEKEDQGPQDDKWLREDIDDRDEFATIDESPVVAELSWPLTMDYDTAIGLIQPKMANEGFTFNIDNIKEVRKTPSRHRVVMTIFLWPEMLEDVKDQFNEQKSDGELGSAYFYGPVDPQEPYYIQQQNKIELEISYGDNDWIMPSPEPPDPDDDDRRSFYGGRYIESTPDSIAQSINEEITIDLAGFLNSRRVLPWTYAPGAGNSPRFSVRPGHEGECVDEESGLMDNAGRDVTKDYQMQHNIDTYIASWTPPRKPRETPPSDPNLLDDEDEFYTGDTECVVFASMGKYSADMDQAVFYNGRWQTVE